METEGGQKRILLVDDDPNICRFISESLRLRGFEVNSFASAELALDKFEQNAYDLALLDILLPGVNGLQLCQKLREFPTGKELPIIMMTAFYKQAYHIREARQEYGAAEYLLKPFPLKTLHAKIDQLVNLPGGTESSGRVDIKGNLTETGFARILHNLYSLRATGLLHVERGDLKKVLYIRNGYPIFARSNLVREFLGQILIRDKIISPEDLENSLETARETGQKHGSALLSMGILTPHQLNDALRQQVIDKLLDIFSWPNGEYRFVQAREFKQGVTSIDISPANLILQGLQEHSSRDQVNKILEPHLDHYLQMAENPLYRFQEIQLSSYDQRVMQQCDGQLALSEILHRHQLSRKKAEPLLAALLTTGILVGRPEPDCMKQETDCEETPKIREQRESFLKDYAWMMHQNYFTLLGVNESDVREQIRKSYYNMVKKYHPDRFFEQEIISDLKEKVNMLFQRISEAHETLIDPTLRAHYISELKAPQPKKNLNLEMLLQAEAAFHKGLAFFRNRKYSEAQLHFDQAVEAAPDEAEYLTYQAWTTVKLAPGDSTQKLAAHQALLRSVELNSRLAITHLYLGYLMKNEGQEREARRRFERAIQCNPDCTEALRELRLIRMRQEKTASKSILGGLFKK